jgi:hypothetical protein
MTFSWGRTLVPPHRTFQASILSPTHEVYFLFVTLVETKPYFSLVPDFAKGPFWIILITTLS